MRKFVSNRWGPLRDGFFVYAQIAMVGGILIAFLICTGSTVATDLPNILVLGGITILVSVASVVPPWHRLPRVWLISVAVADILILALLANELFSLHRELTILALIPTLWLAFSFGLPGLIVAMVGDYFVALLPYAVSGRWPPTPAAWGSATLIPAVVSGVGILVYVIARQLQKQRDEISRAYDDLRGASAVRDEFLQTISHELRTPLASIIGYLEVIEDSVDPNDADITGPLAVIQRNSQRLLALINSLILEAFGRPAPERSAQSVAALARRCVDAVRPRADIAGVTVSTGTLDPVEAELDAGDITEVLEELLSNAIKFNRRGGTVSVSVIQDDADVVIRVMDTGSGIDLEDNAHIFDRFFRGAVAQRDVIAGAGLGLSTVRTIVDAHDGTVTATNLEPHGTSFEVRLPRRAPKLRERSQSTLRLPS